MEYIEMIKTASQKGLPVVKDKIIEEIKQWKDLEDLKSKLKDILNRKARENDMLKWEYAQMEEYVMEHLEEIIVFAFYEKDYNKRRNNYERFCNTSFNFISTEQAGVKNEVRRTMEELLKVIGNHLTEHYSKDLEQTLNTNRIIDEYHKPRLQEQKENTSGFQKVVDSFSHRVVEDELLVKMQSYRSFASCGLEDTVFKIKKAEGEIQASVNFEPTRLRNEIPVFAGIYYLFTPAVDISYSQKIVFDACSEDESIERIWLELKPEGKKWMHESFEFELTKEYQTFSVNIQEFSNMKTAENFEEITFVIKPTSFRDENNLTGKTNIKNIKINV